jgi:hypothetical protein
MNGLLRDMSIAFGLNQLEGNQLSELEQIGRDLIFGLSAGVSRGWPQNCFDSFDAVYSAVFTTAFSATLAPLAGLRTGGIGCNLLKTVEDT